LISGKDNSGSFCGSVGNAHSTDELHWHCPGSPAELLQNGPFFLGLPGGQLDLDQLMCRQCRIEFKLQSIGQTGIAHHYYDPMMVGEPPKMSDLFTAQSNHRDMLSGWGS